jgi:hypothetical protein
MQADLRPSPASQLNQRMFLGMSTWIILQNKRKKEIRRDKADHCVDGQRRPDYIFRFLFGFSANSNTRKHTTTDRID